MNKFWGLIFSLSAFTDATAQDSSLHVVNEKSKASILEKIKNRDKSNLVSVKSPDNRSSYVVDTTRTYHSFSKIVEGSFDNLLGDEPTTAATANMAPVVMPSPNSSVLTNLISDQVDLYTGKTSLKLPIYDLKCGQLNVPIALQSSINAHKVNDIGTSTGLGWNLNAGGVISRVMKNLPDEFTGTICAAYAFNGYGYTKIKSSHGIDLNNFDNLSTQDKNRLIARGNWNNNMQIDYGMDLQPDEFYFNFGNYSGKFFFDQDGGINLVPKANFKITPLYEVIGGINKITGFTILTDGGVLYEFGNYYGGSFSNAPVEESKLTTQSSSITHVYRAIAANNDGILTRNGGGAIFDPATEYFVYERTPYLLGAIPQYYGNSNDNPSVACCLYDFSNPHNNSTTEFFQYPSSWLLRKITAPTDEFISFNYTSNSISYIVDRTFSSSIPDLIDKLTLQGFNVEPHPLQVPQSIYSIPAIPSFISPIAPVYDQFRRVYVLPVNQITTVSTSTIALKSQKLQSIVTSENSIVNFNSLTARLDLPGDTRLDDITVTNLETNIVKKVVFDYDVVTTSSIEEPDDKLKFSFARSKYYYASNGSVFAGMASNAFGDQYGMDNVEFPFVVPEYFRKRMFLKSIQEVTNGLSTPPYTIIYNPTKLPYRTSTQQDLYGYANINTSKNPYVGSAGNMFTYSFKYPFWSTTVVTAPTYYSGGTNFFPVFHMQSLTTSNTWSDMFYGGSKSPSVEHMKAGVLSKVIYPTGGYKEFQFQFNGSNTSWNGLRTNQIIEAESASAIPIIKNYAFGNFVSTDQVIYNFSMMESIYIDLLPPPIFLVGSSRTRFNSVRNNQEKTTRGSTGGYDFVETSQLNNGKKRIEFFTASDFPDIPSTTWQVACYMDPYPTVWSTAVYHFPFPPPTSIDWKRGFPKKDLIYREGSTTPLQENTYHYPPSALYPGKTTIGMDVSKFEYRLTDPISHACGIAADKINHFSFGKYSYTSEWYPLVKKLSKTFNADASQFSESVQEYTFNQYTFSNTDYLLPTAVKDLKDSRNNASYKYTKYPLDYNTGLFGGDFFVLGIKNLKQKSILNVAIEEYQYLEDPLSNKKYVSGKLNKYHPNAPLIWDVFRLRTNGQLTSFTPSSSTSTTFTHDANYEKELTFGPYDLTGQILQRSKVNNIPESYIWAYNKMYPVAKVENSHYNNIAYSGFESVDKGNWLYNNANRVNSPGITGTYYYSLLYTPIPNPQNLVTYENANPSITYTIGFWCQSVLPLVIITKPDNSIQYISLGGPKKTSGNWNFYEANFTNATKAVLSPPGYTAIVDDVKLYPSDALMTTYTFRPLVGMTSETDPNEKISYYEYDHHGRLSALRNEKKHITKSICYNYANQPVPCSVVLCPSPEITSATRPVWSQIIINYTAPANSTSCRIDIEDINGGVYTFQTINCNGSPFLFYPTSKFYKYRFKITSYTAACPQGVSTAWVEL